MTKCDLLQSRDDVICFQTFHVGTYVGSGLNDENHIGTCIIIDHHGIINTVKQCKLSKIKINKQKKRGKKEK